MSLKARYKKLEILRFTKGGFSSPDGWATVSTFKGLIQAPSNRNAFTNGKDTSTIDGLLFTDVKMNSLILEGDKIKQPNGKTYIVSGAGSQPDGVTGIKSHHIEFKLVFDNDSNG